MTILNAYTKNVWKLIEGIAYIYMIYFTLKSLIIQITRYECTSTSPQLKNKTTEITHMKKSINMPYYYS